MKDQGKSKEQLIDELIQLRQRIAELETSGIVGKGMGDTLWELEDAYRTLFEATGAATLIVEEDTTVALVNAEFEKMSGYSKEELEGKRSWTEFVAKDDLDRMRQYHQLRRIDSSAAPNKYECRLIDRRGNVRDAFLTVTLIPGTKKSIVSVHDITERKQAEQALRDSEEKYRSLVETSYVGIATVDVDGMFSFVNRSLCEMTGYNEGEMLRSHFTHFLHEDDKPGSLKRFQKDFEASSTTFSALEGRIVRIVHKSGRIVHAYLSPAPITQGDEVAGFNVIVADITERKEAAERLRQSEQRYRLLADSVADAIWTADLNMRPTHVSPSITRLLGYGVDEVMAKTVQEILTAQSFQLATEMLEDEMAKEISGYGSPDRSRTLELEIRHKDGSIVPVEVRFGFIRYAHGKPTEILAVARDITLRKQADEALQKSRDELRQLYGHLQSVREQERSNIAREIHDQLGQALIALHMDLSWLSKRLPEDRKPLIERASSMLEIIEGTIRTVKRISTELRPAVLDDLGLVAAIEWQATGFTKRTGIRCELSLPEDILVGREPSTTIFHILREALTNVALHANATRVKVRLRQKTGMLVLSISDNGKGIDEARISSNESFGLIGIRERAYSLGGEARFTGSPGKGTTVTVSIPAKQDGETL